METIATGIEGLGDASSGGRCRHFPEQADWRGIRRIGDVQREHAGCAVVPAHGRDAAQQYRAPFAVKNDIRRLRTGAWRRRSAPFGSVMTAAWDNKVRGK
ncbi:hypothetical protein AWV80_20570 [Cupriavidus sp. UYMU48A]|nr:hypothetical protein AWV80_20570 [Cupriavidus sp. UYMU48A]